MRRRRRNPFYVVLGIVGFVFTITATSYCMAVLRVVRPAPRGTAVATVHPLHALMDRHGSGILAAELLVLGIATVGAVWLDHVEGERIRARRAAEQGRLRGAARTPDSADAGGAGAGP
jgi:hypothetical protein